MTAPARRAAHDVLRAVHTGRSDLATALDRARRRLADPRDRALAGEIAIGVQRRRAALDHLVAQASSRPLSAITPAALDLLRAAACQLLYLDRIPAHAAVADTVELAREAGVGRAAGFVNAVLRTLAGGRRRLILPAAPEIDPQDGDRSPRRRAVLDYLAITLSHPRWLVERWLDRHGLPAVEAWARFNNAPAPVTLRANLARNTAAELRDDLDAQGVRTTPTRLAPHGLVVTRGDAQSTPAAAEGRFVVQEEASQLVVELARPAAGSRVLDLCAAPGGKTVGLAGCAAPGGFVVASDLRPRRVALLARFLARAQPRRAAIVRLDATAPLPFGAAFDRVLVDAPCSGLGVLRRDPDVRWRRTPDDLPAFAATQFEMLRRAAETVRPGGRLVYATCSSEPEENEEVVTRFRDGHPEYDLIAPDDPGIARVVDGHGYLRTLPFRDGVEAFFGAVLVRRGG